MIKKKFRFAIGHLADYHFATNTESELRLRVMGFKNVYNHGSLDVEYAYNALQKSQVAPKKPYLLVLYHPIPEEDSGQLEAVLKRFTNYEIKKIGSNTDYRKKFGDERYNPDDFLHLMDGSACVIGNSSSGLKEASIMGVQVVDIGDRQQNRLRAENVVHTDCVEEDIYNAISYQIRHGRYGPSQLYYQKDTSKKIADTLSLVLY